MIQNKVGSIREMSNRRTEQVVITRLRIGHCKLNGTLRMLGKHPTGQCDECQEEETVSHIFMSCRKCIKERQELKYSLQEIGIGQYNVKSILGCGKSEQGNKYLFYFLKRTGLERRI